MRAGILGLGLELPPIVRHNDWWPPEVVESWAHRPAIPRATAPSEVTAGMATVIAAMAAQAHDPFQGTRTRYVLPDDMSLLDLEERASRTAIERAGVSSDDIDVVLTCTTPTDYQLTNSACALHERLRLPTACLALQTEGAQHAFLLQLTIAEAMIVAGRARTALLVQSSGVSRLLDATDPISPVFGDGATAVVVSRVADTRGILATANNTDGRLPNTLIASVPGDTWYAQGPSLLHIADPVGMRDILLRTVDVSTQSIGAALDLAGHTASDVDVFTMHQGMPWLRRLVQRATGLEGARAIDTFADTAHLFGAFVPSSLVAAERQQLLSEGDLVVIAGGGNGMSYGATVMRWGRG